MNNPQWKTVFLRHLFASTEFSKAQNNSSERLLAALMLKIKDRLKQYFLRSYFFDRVFGYFGIYLYFCNIKKMT